MDIYLDFQMDRNVQRYLNRFLMIIIHLQLDGYKIDKQIDSQKNEKIETYINRKIASQKDRQIERQVDKGKKD